MRGKGHRRGTMRHSAQSNDSERSTGHSTSVDFGVLVGRPRRQVTLEGTIVVVLRLPHDDYCQVWPDSEYYSIFRRHLNSMNRCGRAQQLASRTRCVWHLFTFEKRATNYRADAKRGLAGLCAPCLCGSIEVLESHLQRIPQAT